MYPRFPSIRPQLDRQVLRLSDLFGFDYVDFAGVERPVFQNSGHEEPLKRICWLYFLFARRARFRHHFEAVFDNRLHCVVFFSRHFQTKYKQPGEKKTGVKCYKLKLTYLLNSKCLDFTLEYIHFFIIFQDTFFRLSQEPKMLTK